MHAWLDATVSRCRSKTRSHTLVAACSAAGSRALPAIERTLLLLPRARSCRWEDWIVYSDAPPEGHPQHGNSAATWVPARGVLAWNREQLGWLVHSVPGWPGHFSADGLPHLPAAGTGGHQFAWVLTPGSALPAVLRQLRAMRCSVYERGGAAATAAWTWAVDLGDPASAPPVPPRLVPLPEDEAAAAAGSLRVAELGAGLFHVACAPPAPPGCDLYKQLAAQLGGGAA